MCANSLKLVGLAVALMMVGISGSWTVQAQEGMTLDPGAVVTEDVAQQSLLAEALSARLPVSSGRPSLSYSPCLRAEG